jgi:hypothetical protein
VCVTTITRARGPDGGGFVGGVGDVGEDGSSPEHAVSEHAIIVIARMIAAKTAIVRTRA